ncbi:hypothetical protein [Cognatiluteimonas profundi]|uniref:hypothetical protein n=1 Tax=Cognatiluteimonas profundi TaxID=2594501 RepID=UPI00131D7790|nr:hypothetical protein [Lysobacter profundi]
MDRRATIAASVGWLLFFAIVANVLLFTAKSANPLVISDAWHYLASFVEKASRGMLGPSDFFAKRTAIDHSLPLHKLLLLINYRYFHLDFRLDAFVGLGFAIATLLLLRGVLRQSVGEAFYTAPAQVGFIALSAVYLSLNASVIYEWPLLTMGFSTLFFSFLLFACSWQACSRGRYGALLLASAACLIVADDGGIIAIIAASGALVLLAAMGCNRRSALVAIVVLAVSIVGYKVAYQLLAPPYQPVPLAPNLEAILSSPALMSRLTDWIRIPLSMSVLQASQSQAIFGGQGHRVEIALAASIAIAHLLFWWQLLRKPPSMAGHVAACAMFLFYGLCCGVLIARVPALGDIAFRQPRYVIFYQLNIVALMMLAVQSFAGARQHRQARVMAIGLLAASLVLVLIQVPLIRNGWKRQPFAHHYVVQLAAQMDALANDPGAVPAHCLPQLTICGMPEAKRAELMALLRNEHLNLFSPDFRATHGLPATR